MTPLTGSFWHIVIVSCMRCALLLRDVIIQFFIKCVQFVRFLSTLSRTYNFAEKMRFVASYMTLLVRLVLPVLIAAYYAWLRNQRTVVEGVRRQLVPAVLAVIANSISLSALSGPGGKMDPLLRTFRVIKLRPGKLSEADIEDVPREPEKSVTCDVLHDPGSCVRADIIFIHGLHGSLQKTWKQGAWDVGDVKTVPIKRTVVTAGDVVEGVSCESNNNNNTEEPYSPCWPRDWLPVDCPGVRIIALNYTTDPFLWRPLWVTKRSRSCMLDRSREMMEHLRKLGVGNHPIIWVGHSKGGLFVKQMIVDAQESGDEMLARVCENTKGIMFYSVPHRGSSCADVNLPLLRQSVELTEVRKDCREVIELHGKFLSLIDTKKLQAEVFSFIETVQTFMSIMYIQIVSAESADPGIGEFVGAPLDHRNICKPSSRQCFLYRELTNLINRTV